MKRIVFSGFITILLTACATSTAPTASAPTPTEMVLDLPTSTLPGKDVEIRPVEEAAATFTPTPSLPRLTRLTEAGCCAQPFWSADGQMVLFIDKPQPTAATGIYGVNINGASEIQLVSEQVGLPSPNEHYLAFVTDEGETVVKDVEKDKLYTIPNDGLRVFFSPDSTHVAWADIDRRGNFDERQAVIYVSRVDGTDVDELLTIFGGGIAGWLDDDHLLLVGKKNKTVEEVVLFSLSVSTGERVDILENQRIRSVGIAPGGEWIMYIIALHPNSLDQNGLWVVNADGSVRYKLDVVGSGQWRDGSRLIVIPLEPGEGSHRLWQFDAETGKVDILTEPNKMSFKVLGGDWKVSPTGKHVVFRHAEDGSLWLISLPSD